MRTWLRHRLQGEDGISLVEMMIALLILTVAMFALLGGLIASAQSVLDQQLRAEATRVATRTLELARSADFDDLAIETTTNTVTTANGREMTLQQTVEWQDALDPGPGTNEDVKLMTVVVSWSDRGRDREVTYATAIAPPDPDVVGGQTLLASIAPGAVEVDEDGVPVAAVTVTATPDGFSFIGNMTARWTRQDGTLAAVPVPQVGSTGVWQAELPAEDLAWELEYDESVEIDITVVAGGRQASVVLTLIRPSDTAPGPTLANPFVSPDPILLTNPPGNSNNCGTTTCMNVHDVSMGVEVTPFDASQTVERVYAEFDLRDATSPIHVDLTAQPDGVTWLATFAAQTMQFAPGSAQPFNFYAEYDGGLVTAPVTVLREVKHQ
jgi:type II secretory pathway pseudopilin PulG